MSIVLELTTREDYLKRVIGIETPSPALELERTIQSLSPKHSRLLIGAGIGVLDSVIEGIAQGEEIHIFEAEPHLSGKLVNVDRSKAHLSNGTKQLLRAMYHPLVHTHLGVPVALSPDQPGLSLDLLAANLSPDSIHVGSGTTETKLVLPDGSKMGDYPNHVYAYEFTKAINDWVSQDGNRLADFPLDFNHKGKVVLINGAGLVGLEDLPTKILAWQIDNILKNHNISLPQNLDYIDFAAKPIEHLKKIFQSQDINGALLRDLLGAGFPLGNQAELKSKLSELGLKDTIVIYRGTREKLLNKPGTKIKSGSIDAMSRINMFEFHPEREIQSITTTGNEISSVQLVNQAVTGGPILAESYQPALIISSLGGSAPIINFRGHVIDSSNPQQIDGVVVSHMGNAINQLGNMESSLTQSKARLNLIRESNYRQNEVLTPDEWKLRLLWLAQNNLAAVNPVLATLETVPTKLLKRWGWIDNSA